MGEGLRQRQGQGKRQEGRQGFPRQGWLDIGLSQQSGTLPQSHGPAERCTEGALTGLQSSPVERFFIFWLAEPLYRRALEGQERTLGAEHPDTLVSVNDLAISLQAIGLPKAAEPLYSRAFEHTAEHPETLVSVSNLARCFEAMGQQKDAETLYRRALEGQERTLFLENRVMLTF